MKYEAVIFDLGGTLVMNRSWDEYRDTARNIAAALQVSEEDFVDAWFEHSGRLSTGDFSDYQEYIRHICGLLGIQVDSGLVDKAASYALKMTEELLANHAPGAEEVLASLKAKGIKTGLISDCFTDVPLLWDSISFASLVDTAIFSCSVGLNKADSRIFELAIEEMAVEPARCIYVADGMRQELNSAAGIGMKALRIRHPGQVIDGPIVEEWDGLEITSLREVMSYIE